MNKIKKGDSVIVISGKDKPPQLGGPNYGFFAVVAFALAGLAIAAQIFLFAEVDTPDPCTMPNNNCSS
jgi:hypothetical protein